MRNPGYSKLKMQYIIAALIAVITILIIMLIVQATHGQNYKPSYLVNGDIDINYGAALTYFEGTNGLIIVLGPNKLYSNVLMRAEELGIGVQRIVYAGLNLTLALNLVSSHPGSILILDIPYVKIKPNILGPLLAPYLKYGIIAFYNSTEQELQEYALNTLYYAEIMGNKTNGHYLALLPYLSGGPPFTVEVVTDYHGKFDASIGYNLSIRGLLFVLYEQSNDQFYDPCTTYRTQLNLPSGYYYVSPLFNDYASPYSDNYVSRWIWDFCIYYPSNWEYTATVPDYIDIFPYDFMAITPQSSYSISYTEWPQPFTTVTTYGIGLANDYASSWNYYKEGGGFSNGLAPIPGPEVYESPTSQSSVTQYELQIYDVFAQELVDLLQIIIDSISDPANIVNGQPIAGVYANDTWSLTLSNPAFSNTVQMSVGDMGFMDLPQSQTQPSYTGYLPIHGNFTIESQMGPTGCMSYYYYAIELNWYIIYGTSPISLSFNDQSYELWTPAAEGVVCEPIVPS